MYMNSTDVQPSAEAAIVGNNVLAPVKFLIRQINGIQRGELTLDDDTSKLYRNGSYEDKTSIRLELCVGASKHFKTDCYVSEVLNGC
jgi:hypothetical protein